MSINSHVLTPRPTRPRNPPRYADFFPLRENSRERRACTSRCQYIYVPTYTRFVEETSLIRVISARLHAGRAYAHVRARGSQDARRADANWRETHGEREKCEKSGENVAPMPRRVSTVRSCVARKRKIHSSRENVCRFLI